jgi:hypothetical protein
LVSWAKPISCTLPTPSRKRKFVEANKIDKNFVYLKKILL